MFLLQTGLLQQSNRITRLFLKQKRLMGVGLSLLFLAGLLCGCSGPAIGPKPLVNLTPLTPAAPVPLAQLKWCNGASQSVTQPAFPLQLPAMLSADYCLGSTYSSAYINHFSLTYHHSYYNNSFTIENASFSYTLANQGLTCKSTLAITLQPSEPELHTCTHTQGSFSVTLTGPASVEDLKMMLATLQSNVAFLPS